jgi:hypothetical protein
MAPYDTMRVKLDLLRRASRENWLWVFDHEPERKVVRVRQEGDGFVPVEP